MFSKNNSALFISVLIGTLVYCTGCRTTLNVTPTPVNVSNLTIDIKKSSGGSSGMEQLNDSTYLVVYDFKIFEAGVRLGLVILTEETIDVHPIKIDHWDEEGISSDLESVCAVPGKADEFLVAESGNWQGERGRVFHIQLDITTMKAKVLGTLKLPMLHRNDRGLRGDQYEAIHCLPYSQNERIIILGERGGSEHSPTGILRWGLWDMEHNTLNIKGDGLQGIKVNAPGNWTNDLLKRSISDMYIDPEGIIWASAAEDPGDTGPFYSVIYKLGNINPMDQHNPITVLDQFTIGKEILGFKIEALSGPKRGIHCTHIFGTEDEIYGGVMRPINIVKN